MKTSRMPDLHQRNNSICKTLIRSSMSITLPVSGVSSITKFSDASSLELLEAKKAPFHQHRYLEHAFPKQSIHPG